jgi:hypothetical protein
MDTGAPIADATVRVGERSVKTGSDGGFRIEGSVASGERLTADKNGYIGTERFVEASGSGAPEYRLELLREDSPNAPPPPPSQ